MINTSIYRPGIANELAKIENLPKDSRRRQKSQRCTVGKHDTCSGKRLDKYMRIRVPCACSCHDTPVVMDPTL